MGSQEGWGAEELVDRLGRREKYSSFKNKEREGYTASAKKGR